MDIFKSWIVTKYIAHRGLHDEKRPENSLAAFQNAIDNDFAMEFDVQQIEDGTIVVFHDDTLKRLTGKDGYIHKVRNVEELKTYRLCGTDETIPTLSEVLKLVDGKAPLLIEIKSSSMHGDTLEKNVYNTLKGYKGEFAIISFSPYTLKWFRANAPDILRGQISCLYKGRKMGFFRKFSLKHMLSNKTSQPDFICYKWDELPNRFVKKYKRLPLIAWAVPSQKDYMQVAKYCDNVIFEGFLPHI